jgi:hypothetical protein
MEEAASGMVEQMIFWGMMSVKYRQKPNLFRTI